MCERYFKSNKKAKGELISMDISIYDFEDNLHSSQLVEYSKEPIMYDLRKISNQVKKLGRPLTNEEAEKYKVKK